MRVVDGYLPGAGTIRLEIADGRIRSTALLEPALEWDADQAARGLLLPGLVDLQVNGYHGVDFGQEDLTTDDVLATAEQLWRSGVTAFCPTLITAPLERMRASLTVLDDARLADQIAARSLLGAHLEGPWISDRDGARGAHPAAHTRAPNLRDAAALLEGGRVAIVTLAPELDGAPALISWLRDRGILASIGHSAAPADRVGPAVAAGASLSTHLGNGIPTLIERHPNLVWQQLAEPALTAMFIADLHHIDVSTLRAMVRAKGEDRVILVSDVTSIAGLPAGRYTSWIGGEVELTPEGRLTVVGTDYLAGAAHPLIAGLGNVLRHGIMSPAAALDAVSRRPRAALRGGAVASTAPRFEAGSDATLVLADWDDAAGITVRETVIGGESVWSR